MKISILKEKNFALLMFGKITSLVGSSMQSFALSLFVLATTGSATKFASIVAVALIPQLILGPFAGVFVDRFDRKKILIWLDILSGITVAFFATVYFITGKMPIGYIYVLVIILSVISTVFQPALGTIIPSIMKKEDLVDGNAINSLIMGIGNLLAPALAGVLYGTFGLGFIFVFNGISFFVSAFSECFLDIPKLESKNEELSLKVFWSDFSDGISFTLKSKTILSIVTLAMVLNFALGSFMIGTTLLCKSILKVTDFQYGLTESTAVAAMMIATLLTSYLGKKFSVGKNLYLSLFSIGITTIFFGIVAFEPFLESVSSNTIPYIVLMILTFAMGIFSGIANIFVGVYFQSVVPLEYMGRVGTVVGTISMAAMPVSNIIFGVLFDTIPTSLVFPIAGVAMVIAVIAYRKVLLSVVTDNSEVIAI